MQHGALRSLQVPNEPLAVNLILCENVLTETNGLVSAIRVFDVLTIAPGNNFARFFALTTAVSNPGDIDQHVLRVSMHSLDGQQEIARAPDFPFVYRYNAGFQTPGGLRLTTAFNIDIKTLAEPPAYRMPDNVVIRPGTFK
jgi:hypothetical protein